jgi:energy-coupling factor transport system ATP-binding protein
VCDVRVIEIEGLSYRYPAGDRAALDGVDLAVGRGEFVAVVGPNGSGKSTLARVVGGLERPGEARRAVVCDCDLLSDAGRWDARRAVGVLFQDPENQIVGENVEEDLAFGLENLALPPAEIRARVDRVLTDFGLVDLRHREPHLLSGGQKQRTALAGVLAIPRRVLVLDEPTAMLDPAGREEVLTAVRREHAAGLTVVYVTQEMDEVLEADRVVVLEGGRVRFVGGPRELFGRPELGEGLGLGLPPAGAVSMALAARGRALHPVPLTLDELVSGLRDGG